MQNRADGCCSSRLFNINHGAESPERTALAHTWPRQQRGRGKEDFRQTEHKHSDPANCSLQVAAGLPSVRGQNGGDGMQICSSSLV